MEIVSFDIVRLHNEELSQYAEDVRTLMTAEFKEMLANLPQFGEFTQSHDLLNDALEIVRKSGMTPEIREVDTLRGTAYRGFVKVIDGMLSGVHEDKVRAAKNIRIVIDTFGSIEKKPYNEETATLSNFVVEMQSRCVDDVKLLGVGEWIEDMTALNNKFKQLMNARFDQLADQQQQDIRTIRRDLEQTYRKLLKRLNAMIEVSETPEQYDSFVKKFNERILYYKHTLAQRQGVANKKKEEAQPSI